jgi:hypothetical protein
MLDLIVAGGGEIASGSCEISRLVKFFTKSGYTHGRYSLATGLTVARASVL